MRNVFRISTFVLAGTILANLAGVPASAQDTGAIVGWGRQVVVRQSELTDLLAVAAGHSHSLGLKADGSLVAWGYNWDGQCDVPAPNSGLVAQSRAEGLLR